MSGNHLSLAVGALVATGGAVLVLARLPMTPSKVPQSDDDERKVEPKPDLSRPDRQLPPINSNIG
jgi:hypothetical protein